MTSERAKAYGRVVRTVDDKGASKLLGHEQDRIREAIDALFFSELLDDATELASTDIKVLAEHLVEAGRWEEWQAQKLIDDVTACGPVPVTAAA
jgi:hypothetical protein